MPLLKRFDPNFSPSHPFLPKLLKVSYVFSNNSSLITLTNSHDQTIPFYRYKLDIPFFSFPFMVIVRDLDKNDNMVEPLTRDECIALWNNFYRNDRCPEWDIDCKLKEQGLFGSY